MRDFWRKPEVDRSIVHVNVADFAVAVERSSDCRLKRRPVILAPQGTARASVYDMSEEAFLNGVRKRMPLERARRLCRDAVVLAPNTDRYEQAMRELLKHAVQYSPLVEAGEDDGHIFLDVTRSERLFGPAVDVAWKLGRKVKKVLGFSPTWSVASNKLVAKAATRIVKPDGEYVVGMGEEETFLSPLPVFLLPGIERTDMAQLGAMNLTLARHVGAWNLSQLEAVFGSRGRFLYNTVRGVDHSPVLPAGKKAPSSHAEYIFSEDSNDVQFVLAALWLLVERVSLDLRSRFLCTRLLRITLDHSDGMRRFGNAASPAPSANDFTLFDIAKKALYSAWTRRTRIRRLCLICDRLTFPPAQMELFPDVSAKKNERLMEALDLVRARFGSSSISFGRTLTLKGVSA